MSDTAIFIAASNDDLKPQGQLPGDLSFLQSVLDQDDRCTHLELVLEGSGAEKAQQAVRKEGGRVTLLPLSSSGDAALASGLAARLHEFVDAFPDTEQVVLAGYNLDRFLPLAASLRRLGCNVILCCAERRRTSQLRLHADEVQTWGKGESKERESKDRPQQDPFEILVDEVTRSRKNGRRVLLTSLKQRMRRRIRRFDETKIKDEQGRPMRKFKDFIAAAEERGLVKLVESGNKSQVVLPDEDVDAILAEAATREAARRENVDPLLDSVDMVDNPDADDADVDDDSEETEDAEDTEASDGDGSEEAEAEEAEEAEERIDLSETDFDVENAENTDTPPPPAEFVEHLEKLLEAEGGKMGLTPLVETLIAQSREGECPWKGREIKKFVQASFDNELLEVTSTESPINCQIADDWRDIISYL